MPKSVRKCVLGSRERENLVDAVVLCGVFYLIMMKSCTEAEGGGHHREPSPAGQPPPAHSSANR